MQLNCYYIELHWIVMQCRNMPSVLPVRLGTYCCPGANQQASQMGSWIFMITDRSVLSCLLHPKHLVQLHAPPPPHFLTTTFKNCIPFPGSSVRVLSLFFALFFSVRFILYFSHIYFLSFFSLAGDLYNESDFCTLLHS